MTGRRSDASGAPIQGNTAGMGQENGFWELNEFAVRFQWFGGQMKYFCNRCANVIIK